MPLAARERSRYYKIVDRQRAQPGFAFGTPTGRAAQVVGRMSIRLIHKTVIQGPIPDQFKLFVTHMDAPVAFYRKLGLTIPTRIRSGQPDNRVSVHYDPWP